MHEKYVLFTNLEWVTIGPVRTFTHALLLEDAEGLPRQRQCKVRGFGTDPAWPTFDLFVKSVAHELVDAQGNLFKIEEDGLVPLVTGAILKLEDGPEIELVTQDRSRPLDVVTFEGKAGERTILRVWDALQRKVVDYWDEGLNVPLLSWQRASHVKQALGRMQGGRLFG